MSIVVLGGVACIQRECKMTTEEAWHEMLGTGRRVSGVILPTWGVSSTGLRRLKDMSLQAVRVA